MRRNLLMLVALIIWSVVMMINARFQVVEGRSIRGITNPGLAMQFARSTSEVTDLLGDAQIEPGKSNWQVMREQQYLDFVFIWLYWEFFVMVLSAPMRRQAASGLVRSFGWLLAICITVAALDDIVENVGILRALSPLRAGTLWPFDYAVVKWVFFFVALGLSSLILLRYPKFGELPQILQDRNKWLRLVSGFAFLAGSLLGVTGTLLIVMQKSGKVFAYAELALLVAFLFVLLLFLAGIGLLRSIRDNFVSWSIYVYALRIPLLGCLFLLLFPILDLRSAGFAKVSRGILSLENHSQLMFTGSLAILACWLAMVISRVILAYGNKRFATSGAEQCKTPPPIEFTVTQNMKWASLLLWTVPSWPLLARVALMTDFHSWIFTRILDLVVGFALAFVILYLTAWIHLHEKHPSTPLDHAFVMPITAPLKRAYQTKPFSQQSPFGWFFSRLGPGYLQDGRLHSGHSLATVFFLVLLILYLSGYKLLMPGGQGGATYFPVLCYVLILIMILVSCGGALSFFADRYRWPVLTLLVVYSMMFNLFLNKVHFSADHFYTVLSQPGSPQRLTPSEVVEKWRTRHSNDGRPMVVVTATGGGIQASAWTAKVLSELQNELEQTGCKKDPQERNIFGGSAVLISSVSGGSVGSMYFVEHLAEQSGSTPPGASQYLEGCKPLTVAQAARNSSLREAAWGLAYPDVLRTAFPLLAENTRDRGWAIEQAWKRCWPGAERTLNGWAKALKDEAMPAVILNATTAESGQRFLFTNYQPPDKLPAPSGDAPELVPAPSFVNLYPDHDIPVTTATRLSATFTYVTAMAKAKIPGRQTFHLADGGYYDNYGVTSAVEWLLEAILTDPPDPKRPETMQKQYTGRKLLLIEIEASPKQEGHSAVELEQHLPKQDWDWVNQLTAPLSTLMNVRNSGQAERNEVALKMLNNVKPGGVTFQRVIFAFHDAYAPLSWHLTSAQQAAIDENWKSYQTDKIKEIKAAFGCQ